jgi:hypothetical protein
LLIVPSGLIIYPIEPLNLPTIGLKIFDLKIVSFS